MSNPLPSNPSWLPRQFEKITFYFQERRKENIFCIIALDSGDIDAVWKKNNGFGMVSIGEKQYELGKIYIYRRIKWAFFVEGCSQSVDLHQFPKFFDLEGKDTLYFDDVALYNKSENQVINGMIKASKHADLVLYASLGTFVICLFIVAVLMGYIESPMIAKLMTRLNEFRDIAIANGLIKT